MITLMLGSSIEMLIVQINEHRTTITVVNIINVIIILMFVRAIREVWLQFLKVVVSSVPVFIIILSFFIMYIIIGFIFFSDNKYSYDFDTIIDSSYTVFVLFTVSNFPDVELPYFSKSRWSTFYFISFLLIGIFLLSNLLLAQIFLNYKKIVNK